MGDRHNKLKLGVLVSGTGTNLQAILDACEKGTIDAVVSVVISNNSNTRRYHVPTYVIENKGDWEAALLKILKEFRVELVCLAGFMKILSPTFIREYPMRILNIHPALLPSFPGLHAQRKALEHGVKITGATVHFVDEGTDTGPILLQSAVPVYDDDTEETLRQRILKEEHKIYPQAIQLIATQSLKIIGRRVIRKPL